MLNGLLGLIKPNNEASTARLRAPICEQYAREVEDQTFFDHRSNSTFAYDTFATSVKKFGYAGITHLNQTHIKVCFNQVDQPENKEVMSNGRQVYFKNESDQKVVTDSEEDHLMKSDDPRDDKVSVKSLLNLSMLLCNHSSQQDQLNEMWLLVNPALDEEIDAGALHSFVGSLTEIAVYRTKRRLEGLAPNEPVKRAQREQCLKYLSKADSMINSFLSDFQASLPQRLSFEAFSQIVCHTCMNSSQLRMLITNTDQASTSRDVAISQLSTIILSYLTPVEQVQKAQLTCRKWYTKFLPQVMGKFKLNFTPWQNKRFRLAFEATGKSSLAAGSPSLYLALITDKGTDIRENCGRTHYVSAGSSQEYKDFSWTIDSKGTLQAGEGGTDGQRARLAAHRTYINDCVGKTGTFVVSTLYDGHQNSWKLERIGDFESQRYMICLGDSKCVKDGLNQVGWAITASSPQVQCNKAIVRDNNSRYVYVSSGHMSSAARVTPGSLNKFPTWRLEPIA